MIHLIPTDNNFHAAREEALADTDEVLQNKSLARTPTLPPKKRPHAAVDPMPPPTTTVDLDDGDNKKRRRLALNRMSARLRRRRKSELVGELQSAVLDLQEKNERLKEENDDIRRRIEALSGGGASNVSIGKETALPGEVGKGVKETNEDSTTPQLTNAQSSSIDSKHEQYMKLINSVLDKHYATRGGEPPPRSTQPDATITTRPTSGSFPGMDMELCEMRLSSQKLALQASRVVSFMG